MTKIVKADLPHTVLLQDQREMLRDISGLHKLTDFIDIDIIDKLPAIRFSAQLSVQLLFRFQTVQQFLKRRHERQAAIAGFCLCPVLLNDLALAVYGRLRNGVPNRDRLFLEVDGIPFQAYRLTPAKSVKRTENHAKLNGIATDNFKKVVQLILLIEAAYELSFLGRSIRSAGFESIRPSLKACCRALRILAWRCMTVFAETPRTVNS